MNKINLRKLKKEMHFSPAWYKDKDIFFHLLQRSYFRDEDILKFGRLYIKYSHIHCFYQKEITEYIDFMIEKMGFANSNQLLAKTKDIYQKNKKYR